MTQGNTIRVTNDPSKIDLLLLKMAAKRVKFELIDQSQQPIAKVRCTAYKRQHALNVEIAEPPIASQNVTAVVLLGVQELRFDSKISQANDNQWLIEVPKELYKIQQRASFRVTLADKVASSIYITKPDGTTYSGKVKDISNGGCLAEFSAEQDQLSDDSDTELLKIKISIHDEEPLELVGTIKSFRPCDQAGKSLTGLEFIHETDVNPRLDQMIAAVQRYIAREFS